MPTILVVGQMRPGKKRRNYEIVGQVLARTDERAHIVVIGDGPEREAVAHMLPDRARLLGALPHEDVIRHMRGASVMLWPGWREPIGMVYLEAAACALPVAAMADMGVPLVVADGETGLLSPPDDIEALVRNLAQLLGGSSARLMAAKARTRVVSHHSLDSATMTLQSVLARFRPSS